MKRISIMLVAIAAVSALAFLALRPANNPAAPSGKMKVAASFYPLYFFASEIGGDKAEVRNITPAGAEPHDYEPTAQDIAYAESSRLVVLNGIIEPWGTDIKKNVDPGKTAVVTAGDGLFSSADPHVWLDPKLAERMVAAIAEGFAKADPADAPYFRANSMTLVNRLEALNAEYAAGLSACTTRSFVTSHDAFGYLASRYGLDQVAIAGLSPDAEPSPKELADVASFVRKNAVRYIFFESLVSPKLAQTIAAETGAKTLVLNPLEGLTVSDLKDGKDYFSEMRTNLANLKTALECAK